jgi:hypothetical protein
MFCNDNLEYNEWLDRMNEFTSQNTPPDEGEAEKVVADALERMQKGSWKAFKGEVLEVGGE